MQQSGPGPSRNAGRQKFVPASYPPSRRHGERDLERSRRRSEDTVIMDLQEKIGEHGLDWGEGVKWRAFVNAAMNLQFSQNAGNFLTREASQEGLCSMELVICCISWNVFGRLL